MKLKLLILLTWFFSASIITTPKSRPVFGVRVSIGANSQLTTFICYIHNGHKLSKPKVLDAESFVKIVSGYWPSIYNPKRIDLFKENEIDCAIYKDSITLKPKVGCVPIDSLWKIHFSTFPFQYNSEAGWSNKYHRPSLKQEKFLYDRYGVRQIDADFFIDTNFWKLMHDVTDTDWIAHYKSLH